MAEQQLVTLLQQQQHQLQAQQEQLARLAQQGNDLRELITAVRTTGGQEVEALRTSLEAQGVAIQNSMRRRGDGVVDVGKVGKPDMLKGDSKAVFRRLWADWAYTFKTWFCSQFQHGEDILRWAQELNEKKCTHGAVDDAILENPDWEREIGPLSRQLHVSLTALVRDAALTLVKNSCKGETMGLDAWRRLCKEFDPRSATANRRLLKKLTQPEQSNLENLRRSLEQWEADLKEYQDRTHKDLDDDQKCLALQDMSPEALQNHLELHASRLSTYATMKREIDAYLDTRDSRDTGGAAPMDIDALRNGISKSKGKDKGKAKVKAVAVRTIS